VEKEQKEQRDSIEKMEEEKTQLPLHFGNSTKFVFCAHIDATRFISGLGLRSESNFLVRVLLIHLRVLGVIKSFDTVLLNRPKYIHKYF